MKKLALLGILALVVFLGCSFLTRDFYIDEQELPDETKGSVLLILNGGSLPTKTIAPPFNMDVYYYEVTYTGPSGALPISQIFVADADDTIGVEEKTGLEKGSWSVEVVAYNNTDTAIGAIDGDSNGQKTFTIDQGVLKTVLVDVLPYSGNGVFHLFVSWPDDVGVYEELEATINGGSPITFASNLNETTEEQERDYTQDPIAAGYHTLIMQLHEYDTPGGTKLDLLWGWVEAVRIVAGATTDSGTQFELTSMDGVGGAKVSPFMQVDITFDPDPIPDLTKDGTTPLSVTANTYPEDDGTFTYSWYVDGEAVTDETPGTVDELTLAATNTLFTLGTHNLSVVVGAGGTLSSNTIEFTVIQ